MGNKIYISPRISYEDYLRSRSWFEMLNLINSSEDRHEFVLEDEYFFSEGKVEIRMYFIDNLLQKIISTDVMMMKDHFDCSTWSVVSEKVNDNGIVCLCLEALIGLPKAGVLR